MDAFGENTIQLMENPKFYRKLKSFCYLKSKNVNEYLKTCKKYLADRRTQIMYTRATKLRCQRSYVLYKPPTILQQSARYRQFQERKKLHRNLNTFPWKKFRTEINRTPG